MFFKFRLEVLIVRKTRQRQNSQITLKPEVISSGNYNLASSVEFQTQNLGLAEKMLIE